MARSTNPFRYFDSSPEVIRTEVVTIGPYSISRNPLYLFNYAGAFGIGAQTGTLVIALLFVAIAMVVFHFTIAGGRLG